MKPVASALVQLGIPSLAVLVLALLVVFTWRHVDASRARWLALGCATWLGVSALMGTTGVLSDFEAWPPRLLLLLAPTLALPLLLACSSWGGELARRWPLPLLVGFQGFRLPLELVMHQAALDGTMPAQMTYTGSNFDIVSGATALLVAGLAAYGRAPRWLVLAWNGLGSLLLLAILVIALASLTAFHAFGSDPSRLNTWVAYFPYVWLPAGLVAPALLGHLLLWRRLLARGMRGRALAAAT